MEDRRTRAVDALRLADGSESPTEEQLLFEAPLEIHLNGELVATTMRTPGDDFELAAGLLWSEGRISGPGVGIRRCPELGSPLGDPGDVVCVDDDAPVTPPESGGERPAMPRPRLGLTASSCGVCGVEQIEALVVGLETLEAPPLSRSSLFALIDTLGSGTAPASQELFARTGGAHAAMVTDARGSVLVQREDIGRHNAVDKVVGRLLLDGVLPALLDGAPQDASPPDAPRLDAKPSGGFPDPGGAVLMWVSGRVSFEIVQKAWAAGIPLLVSVGAASALAVDTARRAGMTLLGFSRDGRATLYTAADSHPAQSDLVDTQ